MTFEIIKGDLFDPVHNFDAIAQGVNTYGIMGAGIAVKFRQDYPEMYEEYAKLCKNFQGILPGLLHVWESPVPSINEDRDPEETMRYVAAYLSDTTPTIYNLFSQTAPGKNGSYELLQKSALLMRLHAEGRYLGRVGLPWIGCGIAGLERHNVQNIFENVFSDSEVNFTLVEQA